MVEFRGEVVQAIEDSVAGIDKIEPGVCWVDLGKDAVAGRREV